MSDERPGGDGGVASLDEALGATVRRTGALADGVYLLSAQEPVLGLAAVCGMPRATVAPWRRVAVSAAGPLSEAVREDRLVWVGRQEDMARPYPNAAAGMPYQFAVAFTPCTACAATGSWRWCGPRAIRRP
ncbi:hypothetical protein [Streptomyces sp. NPDC014676]|uniref:hypothetical protein n=1 Tax=Streptomyces sp. NPDC014676 TaxID=3364879 RepID=UPI0036FAAEFF